jgi:hypothetical protein
MQMANNFVSPNHYQLHGRGLHVTYSTTGIEGKPHFSYQDSYGAKAFSGDEIKLTQSPIGTLATVVIRVTPDAGTTSFSVLIPIVNLSSKAPSAPIRTDGITTVHRSSIAPPLDLGQIQTYHVAKLSGVASQVAF